MSEWWTYRLSDFLLFSPATYYRMFELYNRQWWPLHVLTLAAGVLLAVRSAFGVRRSPRLTGSILALMWVWVAWAFLFQRYSQINWSARWLAALFLVEGALLVLVRSEPQRSGAFLIAFALFVHPLIGVLCGRSWLQIEFFGMTADPTAIATLGAVGRRWPLSVIPLLWCAIDAATFWTLKSAEGLVPLFAAAAWIVTTANGERRTANGERRTGKIAAPVDLRRKNAQPRASHDSRNRRFNQRGPH